MKMQGQSLKFVLEAKGVPGFEVKVSIAVRGEMLDALNAAGIGEGELANFMHARLEDTVLALDGSVPGLIVPNLET